ncbi:MAG: L-seryl-tRNA(Sec) selenium transferase [Deltaproteobacteria bacterium]|nr:L-seryl-tRNA(Sec) selenium transferase [Deltaproteobacteria bacterium]
MDPARAKLLRQLPAVDEVLRHPQVQAALSGLSRPFAAEVVRQVIASARGEILAAPAEGLPAEFDVAAFLKAVAAELEAARRPSLTRVVNGTGIIIHTNLGRSPLAAAAQEAVLEAARSYSNLEYDLKRGARGSRQAHLEELLTELTKAEAALVVNNNAAAVMLALSSLAAGKEVIISRGQLVEIGGSFRMPEIMAASGAILREVGTTNKTYLKDYERAITGDTALLLKVHPSNFRIVGFTREVSLTDLVSLGRRYGLFVMEDLGSGCFVDLSRFGLEKEPTVQDAVATGCDVVTFSGDKLLGGPQAGIILGRREALERLRQNPQLRALRPDKLTLAGLEASLRLYLDESRALAELPTLAMVTRPLAEVERHARRLARLIHKTFGGRLKAQVKESVARVGGGALAQEPLPSRALALSLPPLAPHQLEARLRQASPPIITRVEHDTLLLDVRTLLPHDQPALLAGLKMVVESLDSE